ncbi:hypothetical protein NSQ62_14525 [Solibacillus sp. FSL H8-0523]|uniref:hypothetical protein n=1 Tax=Solibacillus sp. FSL H8-0523 TaxID=2954511 RepID=UPI003101665F
MTEFDKNREELLATYHAIGTDVMTVPIAEYNKLVDALDRTELAEVKARMENERLRKNLTHLRELWRYGTPEEVYDNLPRIAQMILDDEEGVWIG